MTDTEEAGLNKEPRALGIRIRFIAARLTFRKIIIVVNVAMEKSYCGCDSYFKNPIALVGDPWIHACLWINHRRAVINM